MNPTHEQHHYTIVVRGHLSDYWLRESANLTISLMPQGDTHLCGSMDQSALFGVLNRLRDLGADILSVQREGA